MKKLQILMMAMAGCFVVGCDDTENEDKTNYDVVGTYNLSAFNAPTAQDFDGNGTRSANLLEESSCYNNSRMTVNSSNTYTLVDNYVDVTGDTSSCATKITSGSWSRSGNTFTTMSGNGSNMVINNYTFTPAGNSNSATMSRNVSNAYYPSINTSSGKPQSSSGDVNMVYTGAANGN